MRGWTQQDCSAPEGQHAKGGVLWHAVLQPGAAAERRRPQWPRRATARLQAERFKQERWLQPVAAAHRVPCPRPPAAAPHGASLGLHDGRAAQGRRMLHGISAAECVGGSWQRQGGFRRSAWACNAGGGRRACSRPCMEAQRRRAQRGDAICRGHEPALITMHAYACCLCCADWDAWQDGGCEQSE